MPIRRFFELASYSVFRILIAQMLLFVSGTFAVGQTKPFTLSVIARTGDTIAGHTLTYLESPLINNNGQVVFTDGPVLVTPNSILASSGEMDRLLGQGLTLGGIIAASSLNSAGMVAFSAGIIENPVLDNFGGIFTIGIGETLPNLVFFVTDPVNALRLSDTDPPPLIDNSGRVVFLGRSRHSHTPPPYSTFLMQVSQNGMIRTLMRTGDNVAGRTIEDVGAFGVSGEGVIAAEVTAYPLGGVFSATGVILSLKDIIDGHSLDYFGSGFSSGRHYVNSALSINDSGTIAITGRFDCDSGCLNAVSTQYHLISKQGDILGGYPVGDFGSPVLTIREQSRLELRRRRVR